MYHFDNFPWEAKKKKKPLLSAFYDAHTLIFIQQTLKKDLFLLEVLIYLLH